VRMGVDHLWLVDDDTIHSENMGHITRKSG
jgi:hypothetical protein